nr:uncharacterized protein LOC106025342 [Cavia porcellus]
MGQAESKFSTPLSLVLDHFKEFKRRSEGYGERVHKARLTTFVTQEWPLGTQGVWPPSGSFNMEIAQAARQYVFGSPAHPDQIVYIQIWIDIICDAPSWIKPSQDRVFAALKPKVKPKKLPSDPTTPPVLPSEEDPLDPLEALSLPPPHPASDPQPDSSAPSLPCPGHTCRHPQPEASSEQSSEAAPLCPLREVPRLGGSSMFVYTPFSFSDLYYWKSLIPPFSKDPETLINLLESLFYTHRPTWGDCQQILLIFFTAEERLHIRTLGQNAVRELDGSASTDQQRIERLFPSSQPNWDPNTDEGKKALYDYRLRLLDALHAAATNLSRVTEVRQLADESPAMFLERLLEAYRLHTPINPMAPENARAINIAFVSQSAPDVREKLQKLEGFEGMPLSQLKEIAQKVFKNRESLQEATNKKMTKVLELLCEKETKRSANANKRKAQGRRPPLDKEQCAYCKEMGHWRKDCPTLKAKLEKKAKALLSQQ